MHIRRLVSLLFAAIVPAACVCAIATTTADAASKSAAPAQDLQHQMYPINTNGIVAYQGIDACYYGSTDQMQTWWNYSPYWWTNAYIGGANVCTPSYGLVTYSWLSAVTSQGWDVVPTWVDLQAPCQGKGFAELSTNTSTAHSQGTSSADAAANRAASLGINTGSVIYYDMEHYNNYVPLCDTNVSAAVNAFLDGWVAELGNDGYVTGLYESASNLLSVTGNTHRPSNVWIGGGGYSASTYSCAANVWGNSYIPDADWLYDQRLYQYTGGHSETWPPSGGVTLSVDSDAAIGAASPVQYDDYSDESEGQSNSYDVPAC